MTLDLHLFGKDHITNFFPAAAHIWTSSHHELIADDAKSEVVNCKTVILTAHDLRCHIARSTRRVLRVLRLKNLRDAHVGNSYIAVRLHHDILGLDVPMDHALIVHVFKSEHHARKHELCLFLRESATLAYVVA